MDGNPWARGRPFRHRRSAGLDPLVQLFVGVRPPEVARSARDCQYPRLTAKASLKSISPEKRSISSVLDFLTRRRLHRTNPVVEADSFRSADYTEATYARMR